MKAITPQQLETIVEGVLTDREKQSKILNEPFNGLPSEYVWAELNKRVGTDWSVKKSPPFKFTKEDINAIANGRFYKKTGIKLLMLAAIIGLALAFMTVNLGLLPPYVYYALIIILIVGFIYVYGKKQRETRLELWRQIEGENVETTKGK